MSNLVHMDIGTFGKHTLLTGAGFSRNWGGYTAPEMMGQILGYLQDHEESRTFWLETSSFEEGLAKARNGDVSDNALQQIENAIREAFISLDRQLQRRNGPWFNSVETFLSRFYSWAPSGITPDSGYLFTLNQDLLIERFYYNNHMHRHPTLPRVRLNGVKFFSTEMPREYNDIVVTVESNLDGIIIEGNLNYVKLHGSFNWQISDGQELMVLGNKKAAEITEQPLLNWYREIFEKVLFAGHVRLMVIGYGFEDEHINSVIAQGVREHNLRIFVWDRQHGFNWIKEKPAGEDIVSGLIGAESREMIEVFPRTQEVSESYHSICSAFFRPASRR